MIVETSIRNVPAARWAAAARLAERLGFDTISQPEIRTDPFLVLAAVARETSRIGLATGVAIAFARSPMIVAYGSRNLHDLSGGRFALGLGTQVRGHVVRRFSGAWDPAGPRLREYVLSLRAIWAAWHEGRPLDVQGTYYSFTLMTPEFDLGPMSHAPIPIQLAAVNPYNIRLAGELGDGLRVHSFATPAYVRDVIWPNVRQGAAKSGRPLDAFRLLGGGFIATGADEAEVRVAREAVRKRIAFYASTPAYVAVLAHHGWSELNRELRALVSQRRWDDLSSLVSDEMLETFCTSGTYRTLADAVRKRLGGLTDGISLSLPADLDGGHDDLQEAIRQIRAIPGAARAARSAA